MKKKYYNINLKEDVDSFSGDSNYQLKPFENKKSFFSRTTDALGRGMSALRGKAEYVYNGINNIIAGDNIEKLKGYENNDIRDNQYKNKLLQIIKNSMERAGEVIKAQINAGKKFIYGVAQLIISNKILNPQEKTELFDEFIAKIRLFARGNKINFNDMISENEVNEIYEYIKNTNNNININKEGNNE